MTQSNNESAESRRSENEVRRNDDETNDETPSSAAARDHDRFLPVANVSRIMKKALPTNAKISKDAKETVQECVSEFISFVTGEAADKCLREKRKTLNGDDILWAMAILGFEDYVEFLRVYLLRYRAIEEEKTGAVRDKDAASSGGGGGCSGYVESYNGGNSMGQQNRGHVDGYDGFHQIVMHTAYCGPEDPFKRPG